ncbi:uncharacterized protein LOC131145650 isoform X3 [Malania oleifera]|uniref:uncharacterized protein LOC131145650 isoform X3 n=1 Tax=Malania oleifera TaxID=397392 RepID=UPI0025AEB1FA|nr:uncharacterized protein LOC131145650 isoform X3 [Malania oleifera]
MDPRYPYQLTIHLVTSTDSPEFAHLSWALTRSSLVALDAEWKPIRTHQPSFPRVSLLQLACRLGAATGGDSTEGHCRENSVVFLLDLLAIPLPSIYDLLRDVFNSPDILKLGFRFKQDLIYLSSTFCSEGCDHGFDRVEPFIDITSICNFMQHKLLGRKIPKETKSLATICNEVLGIFLSKELQCSDWSHRPLTEEQKIYAAADAHCLLEIFTAFQVKVIGEDISLDKITDLHSSNVDLGLKDILGKPDISNKILRSTFFEASKVVRASASELTQRVPIVAGVVSKLSCRNTIPMGQSLLKIVKRYGDKILLKESDSKPRISKKKVKRTSSAGLNSKEKLLKNFDGWQGPPPWDSSLGGDGCPKFLCDVMVEGLAKHLRCVGIDAAIPYSRKPESRELLDQARREKRVLLTRDAKLLRHEYLIQNQIYRVKNLLKNEQLLEGTQYHNAVQKFIDVCKLKG